MLKGVFALLSNRYTMLQLRASIESDATSQGGAEALRAKLAFIEEKVYAGSDGLAAGSEPVERSQDLAQPHESEGEVNWVNPPWSLLDEVVHKLREEGCAATVVAPYWPGQMWFQQLEAMADVVAILPRSRDLFTPSRLGGSELLGASSSDGIMFRISASQ
ncbi:hypothetical protein CYMTET_21591 [Cymbomonas tetramitiformis]|uniref:Uncharacterized protein n=1 Tax=Cymbomonas tetramitiformis TaxID=36881 RepID=A0AAE0L2T7_9CHLO|nr:hypothetical protein CYMTET_21591 [Cymbomonas tetramitiformis]